MSFPPLPPPSEERPPGQGGGFGSPQGFGPSAYPPQPQQPPQPPRRGPGGGAKVAVGAVVLVAVIVGGAALVFGGGSDHRRADAKSRGSVTAPPASASSSGARTVPSASPHGTGTPYLVLRPGECFDTPGLDSSITTTVRRSCSVPHDGEVIANETITGSFATQSALRAKVLELCRADVEKHRSQVPNDAQYYYYTIYPSLATYERSKKDTVSCSLTISKTIDGKKLTKPLP